MSVVQTRPSRLASLQAIEKTHVILSQDDITDVNMEEIVEVTEADIEKNMKKKTKNEKANSKLKSTNIIPIVTQNSKKYDLNYFKQFNKQLEYCERDLYRIHDPIKNKNDHGSKDHGLVYIEFNAGLFQAMKSNMMILAKDFNIVMTTDPKVELYGNAEERMLLDLKVCIKEQEHFIKMKVYNTTCGMDFQALKHNTDKKFHHLDGRTVGEYFTQTIIVDIVNTICKKIDIEKLNKYIKKLAIEGREAVKTVKKCAKFDCSKDTSKGATLSCIYCESLTHKSCTSSVGLEVSNYRCELCLINNITTTKSVELQDNERILKLSTIDAITTNETAKSYTCILCGETFQAENAMRVHTETAHEARKRLRGDTSLVEGRCDCEIVSEENKSLRNELHDRKDEVKQLKLELEGAMKDVNEQKERFLNFEEQAKIESETKVNLIKQQKDTIENIKKDLETKIEESDNLRKEIELLKSASVNQKPDDELQRLRVIIQDREKAMKKAADEHKKELAELERSKINAEENLNSAIQENTKIKEKESTMYEIMEGLRKLLDLKDKEHADKPFGEEIEPDVEVIEDGASGGAVPKSSGGAVPKSNSYKCEKCPYTTTNINILNKHIRQEHISTLYPCVICDLQVRSMEELRNHQKNEHVNTNPATKLNCANCKFVARTEKELSIHKITHMSESSFNCELCDFTSESKSTLYSHEKNTHNKSKYQCNLCTKYFAKPESLEEHKTRKHNIDMYPCNDCGFKSKSLTGLDSHIESTHDTIKKNKDTDIRDLSGRVPCDPSHPSHTSECCDRRSQNKSNHTSGSEERRSRGQCRFWSKGRCYRGNSCRYAHIELCKFQDQCRYYETCVYLHFSEQEHFLDSKIKNRFVYREEDFPQLQKSSHCGRRNL